LREAALPILKTRGLMPEGGQPIEPANIKRRD